MPNQFAHAAIVKMAKTTPQAAQTSQTASRTTSETTNVTPSRYLPVTSSVQPTSSEIDQVSYSLGYLMANGNKDIVDDLVLDAFFQGFRDAYQDRDATLSKARMQRVLLAYQKRKEIEYAKQIEATAADNAQQAEQFLRDNAKQAGVRTTASGLQYQILKAGTGARPTTSDNVKVHYEGKLIDGTVFDSSYKRGEPVTFPLNQVIAGWREGVPLMQVGAKYRFFVPPALGYGAAGNAEIEPNSVLIFDIELLQINPKPAAQDKK
ncbi:peptidylprolyl isomerase [Moraxella atlantae]|uniref:Peptidyl-prolyl cis-trans isomerase n=2 Tax=Faucicola atlantae TaxID=34059 RepID=A0A1B8QD53_9GAMM|nr:peptidylprolyl isomerase [Moraxella atlantae]